MNRRARSREREEQQLGSQVQKSGESEEELWTAPSSVVQQEQQSATLEGVQRAA